MEHFITALHINHVRHLKNIEIQRSPEKRQHLILTGRNGSGKTSVLDALKWYLYLYPYNEFERSSFLSQLTEHPLKRHQNITDLMLYEHAMDAPTERNFEHELTALTNIAICVSGDIDELRAQMRVGSFITACYEAVRNYRVENAPLIEKISLKRQRRLFIVQQARTKRQRILKTGLKISQILCVRYFQTNP